MESLQWLERIADVELLARRGDQFRVTRRHLADQHRMCVEVVTLHNPDISAAISRRRKKSFPSALPGWQPVPPSACVEMAPQAAPYRMAASTDWPASPSRGRTSRGRYKHTPRGVGGRPRPI